jgi:hypothetical protein
VAAGDEEVDAELIRRRRLAPEAVHAVETEEDAVCRRAIAVRVRDHVGDLPHRQLHPRRRVHPRQR